MADQKKDNGFFDMGELDALDKQIAERMARPTLVKQLKDKNRKKKAEGLTWGAELANYYYVYIFLLISSMFTGTLGIYMGLSPTLVTDATGTFIHFNTDIGHLLLAVVYFVAFIGVTEVAFAIAKWKFFTREERNTVQQWTMIAAMGIAGISILGTGIAGGTVVASNIAFLSEFVHISPAAQKWVVVAIPVLITLYTFLFSTYALSSDQAASERLTREQERENDLDHRTRLKSIEQIGAQQLQVAEIRRYQQLVLQGRISAADAQAAIRAGRTLGQEETRQNRDIDGRDGIGNNAPSNHRQGGNGANSQQPPQHSLDELCRVSGMSRDQLRAKYGDRDAFNEFASKRFDYISGGNLRGLYGELMQSNGQVKNPT